MRKAAVSLAAALALVGCGGRGHGTVQSFQLQVRLGLKRDQARLFTTAYRVNDPASPRYGRFRRLRQIDRRFGAPQRVRTSVLDVLREHGVTGRVDATGGMVEAQMTPKQAGDLFGVRFNRRRLEDGSRTIEPRRAPTIPRELRGLVTEVVGLARSRRPGAEAPPPRPQLDPAECTDAKRRSAAILERYGLARLHARGLRGHGMTVAVTAVDAFDGAAVRIWARCLGLTAPPVRATGRSSEAVRLGSSHEAELDLDTLVAAAPALAGIETIVFDPVGWPGEPYETALERPAGPPAVISSSETYCEKELSAADRSLTEWELAAAAAVGVTVVVASGDRGSSGCAPQSESAAVQYPAASPFVTAVGGTEIAAGRESVWSNRISHLAGGGGVSASAPRPPYQHTGLRRRAIPDVAYAADPAAWPPIPVCNRSTCTWTAIGGTSASAPLFAAGVALIKQAARRAGKVPPGLLNTLIYRDARAATDVLEGSNDVYGTGCCSAASGFDTASGWGVFSFPRLLAAVRAAAPTRTA